MTDAEKQEHKEKVKKVMVDHLTALGYPDIPRQQILAELKNMWVKIEEAGLVVEDMNFQAFHAHAQNAFMLAEVQDLMGL